METKPSSRLGCALSASGAVLIENPLWHFNCFHYASIQPTNTNAIRAALLFPFRFQVAYLRFWFATVFRTFRDIFRILKPAREPLSASLPRWRTTGRALPLWLGVCSHCIEWWYLFQKNFKEATKKAYPNLEWHLQRPHTFQWATLLVLVGKQPASIRGFAKCMWCLCLFVLRCKQCGTWAWTAST